MGIGADSSTMLGAKIVANLAKLLQYPITVAQKSGGNAYIVPLYDVQNIPITPIFVMNIIIGINDSFSSPKYMMHKPPTKAISMLKVAELSRPKYLVARAFYRQPNTSARPSMIPLAYMLPGKYLILKVSR